MKNRPSQPHKYRFRLQKGDKYCKYFFIFKKYIGLASQRTFNRPHIFKIGEDTARWTFVSSAR